MKTAVLFCTSPLQVINVQSALDYLTNKDQFSRRLFVVITHPGCTTKTKDMIRELSTKFGSERVIDLSQTTARLWQLMPNYQLSLESNYDNDGQKVNKLFNLVHTVKDRVTTYFKSIEEVERSIKTEIGDIDEIFCRYSYKTPDGLFLLATEAVAHRYLIEDGHGEYLPKYWTYRTLNIYNILHAWRHNIRGCLMTLLSFLITGEYKIAEAYYFRPRLNWKNRFTNLPLRSGIDVGSYFRKNVERLYKSRRVQSNRKILIFGSMWGYPRFEITREREIEIYNRVIDWIVMNHSVSKSEIWYKPHPRCSPDEWSFKKENLRCQVWDYDDKDIGEVELLNPHVQAVYSVGSTSLLYAKVLFSKTSGIIDIQKEAVHRSSFAVANTVAKNFGIPKIPVVW